VKLLESNKTSPDPDRDIIEQIDVNKPISNIPSFIKILDVPSQ
jgi:hypothetical protein